MGPRGRAHLGIEHVDAEVTEGRLEEVVLGAVLEEGAVHGIGSHLCACAGGTVSSGLAARGGGRGDRGRCVCVQAEARLTRDTKGREAEDQPREVGQRCAGGHRAVCDGGGLPQG